MEQKAITQICVICERVKVTEGTWLLPGPLREGVCGTEISHGICPDCMAKAYPEPEQELTKPIIKK